MGNYLFSHYKGKYRVEAQYDKKTNDVPRDEYNNIVNTYDDTYIACKNGNKIFHYGGNKLLAYIPSIIRGKRIVKELLDEKISISNTIETDEEVEFRFSSKDIEVIAQKLNAKTSGSDISPYSPRRFKVNKNVSIPTEKMDVYKEVTASISKEDKLLISRITNRFLIEILAKNCKVQSISADMKRLNLARQTKEYILEKGLWDEYIKFLRKELSNYEQQIQDQD